MTAPVLAVDRLGVAYRTPSGWLPVVEDVSFAVRAGETLGIVGESGCGKSVTARAILRLVEFEKGRITSGTVRYRDANGVEVDVTSLPPDSRAMRALRGGAIAMIFQEPMASFSPVYTIGQQIAEPLRQHLALPRREARAQAIELLDRVRMPDPARRIDAYPHELSGGMRQRAMIAMAIACSPRVLIADEPTTALDVTIAAQILALLDALRADTGMASLIITHDLAVVSEMSDHVVVMYAGRVAEYGTVAQVLDAPFHPYTAGLLRSRPQIGREGALRPIEGSVPDPRLRPPGCPFAPRCPAALEVCHRAMPPEFAPEPGRRVRCWLHADAPPA